MMNNFISEPDFIISFILLCTSPEDELARQQTPAFGARMQNKLLLAHLNTSVGTMLY